MIKNLFYPDFELFIYILIEALIIISFIIFSRYSRNNGGAFDRRVSNRRDNIEETRIFTGDRRIVDMGSHNFGSDYPGLFEAVSDRRVSDRRTLADRRAV